MLALRLAPANKYKTVSEVTDEFEAPPDTGLRVSSGPDVIDVSEAAWHAEEVAAGHRAACGASPPAAAGGAPAACAAEDVHMCAGWAPKHRRHT